MDNRLIPALLDLIADPCFARTSAVATLRDGCVAYLTERAARPLAPPADLTRANNLTCACADCSALARFLADPALAAWSLKAVQSVRSHVETTICNSHCDVDTATVRQGSPHRLAVTKNQASYDRLAKQRRDDLEILGRIGGAG
jgi:hypothetical protein